MPALHLEVTIERPGDVIWAYLADPRNEVEWQRGVLHSTYRPLGPIQAGTTKFSVRRTPFENQLTEVEYTHVDHAAREWRDLVTVGSVRGSTGHCRVVPYGQGTRVVLDMDVRATGLRKLFMPMIRRSKRSELTADLATLKAVLERAETRVS